MKKFIPNSIPFANIIVLIYAQICYILKMVKIHKRQ